jgi:hypothetical protein
VPSITEEDKSVEPLQEQVDKIVSMREEHATWDEIADAVGISAGKVTKIHMSASVKPKDRIKGRTDEDIAAAIVKARDEDQLSWGQIMVRSGLPETRCRKIYENVTGNSTRGNRIGKGGRYPDGIVPPERASKGKEEAAKKAAASKAATAKAPAKKPAAKKAPVKSKLGAMTTKDLAAHLMNKSVTYKHGGSQLKVRVTDVLDISGTGDEAEVTVQTADDNQAILFVSSILRVATR